MQPLSLKCKYLSLNKLSIANSNSLILKNKKFTKGKSMQSKIVLSYYNTPQEARILKAHITFMQLIKS